MDSYKNYKNLYKDYICQKFNNNKYKIEKFYPSDPNPDYLNDKKGSLSGGFGSVVVEHPEVEVEQQIAASSMTKHCFCFDVLDHNIEFERGVRTFELRVGYIYIEVDERCEQDDRAFKVVEIFDCEDHKGEATQKVVCQNVDDLSVDIRFIRDMGVLPYSNKNGKLVFSYRWSVHHCIITKKIPKIQSGNGITLNAKQIKKPQSFTFGDQRVLDLG